jgi:hypothetical protein
MSSPSDHFELICLSSFNFYVELTLSRWSSSSLLRADAPQAVRSFKAE